ncbi:MAG: choice-of-anchor Q domain-containing protein [Rudaea sp.]
MKTLRRSLSLHPLAASLALVLGMSDIHAAVVVQNCKDSGAGSLRQAVIDNTSGPIDLTQLACSRITLTSGAINVQRAQLIKGPGAALLEIDGAHLDRVFSQTSTQPLALYGMTIQNGYATSFGAGCIYSAGTLQLKDSVVRNCHVSNAGSGTVKGGGVHVLGDLTAINSSIRDNEAYSSLGNAFGGGAVVAGAAVLDHSTISGNVVSNGGSIAAAGGIDVAGVLTMMYSTISDNSASGLPTSPGSIGGARAFGGATITQSTISGNSSGGTTGGLRLYALTAPNTIIDSTISGNSSRGVGGIYASGSTSIMNSTIAFNVETGSQSGGGLRVANSSTNLQSTIVAANMSGGGVAQNIGFGVSSSVAFANSLIGPSPPIVPAGTVVDPKLFPLHDNGGPTKTHALRPGSPAVNAGNVVSGYTTDQRGAGFPRKVGAVADIGAYEGVDTDSIFFNEFD